MANTVVGVVLSLIGGILNATWPLVVNDKAPHWLSATKAGHWKLENCFFIFGFFQIIILYVWVAIIFGWTDFQHAIQISKTQDILLVCVFSFIWSFGTYTYGLAAKLAGPALGISLVLSLVVVIGTLLPIFYDPAAIESAFQLGFLIAGILLALIGFSLSAYSGQLKEKSLGMKNTSSNSDVDCLGQPADVESEVPVTKIKFRSNVLTGCDNKRRNSGQLREFQIPRLIDLQNKPSKESEQESPRWTISIIICVISGITSSMLQFAFVFGENLVDIAEGMVNKPEAIATLMVWIFAFSIEACVIIIFSGYQLIFQKSYQNYFSAPNAGQVYFSNLAKCFCMAFAFITHIQLYGVAQAELGDLGAALAWPLLMVSTVCSAQIWSLILREWKNVQRKAKNINFSSMGILILSAVMIAIAGCIKA